MTVRVSAGERFWAKVEKTDGCWWWTGGRSGDGYGAFSVSGRNVGAHIFAWEDSNGEQVPRGLWVLHRCDHPTCVRPDHLFIGSFRDNIDDMVAKGRSLAGETNPKARLTSEDVVRIRWLATEGMGQAELADLFEIGRLAVNRIVRRETWQGIR